MFREGSLRGFGVRVSQSAEGSDSWLDDPITRHIIGIYINKEEDGDSNVLWPLILHTKGHYVILIFPLVEPRHLKAYVTLCNRSDCGNAVGVEDSISSILLDLPSITGYGKLLAMLFRKNIILRSVSCFLILLNIKLISESTCKLTYEQCL